MIQEAYASGQSAAFVKLSMRREDRQRLAKEHGIVPGEGAWNWALRRSRQGATPQDLGMAPKSLIDKIWMLTLGNKGSEAGAHWGKGIDPIVTMGGKGSVDIGGNFQKFLSMIPVEELVALKNALMVADPKARQRVNDVMDKAFESSKGLNTIHSHPPGLVQQAIAMEKELIPRARENNRIYNLPESQAQNRLYISDADATERLRVTNETFRRNFEQVETRHKSALPELYPSGYVPPEAFGEMAHDGGFFKAQGVGTHHNIVGESGVGVHTLRPDKVHGGERLRSVLWNQPPKPGSKALVDVVKDVFKDVFKARGHR